MAECTLASELNGILLSLAAAAATAATEVVQCIYLLFAQLTFDFTWFIQWNLLQELDVVKFNWEQKRESRPKKKTREMAKDWIKWCGLDMFSNKTSL